MYIYNGKMSTCVKLGNIAILSFIVILKCYDNPYEREVLSIIILATQ